ncbi:MAG: D-alanyl-D-alanine carboxypeptidase [Lachnospiraceae bacterium]
MKYTNKCYLFVVLILISSMLVGCSKTVEVAYIQDDLSRRYDIVQLVSVSEAIGFSEKLCVGADSTSLGDFDLELVGAAGFFDLNNNEVLYSSNMYSKMYPASTTKVLTALVAIKYGNLDQELVATDAVYINEIGATLLGLEPGDTMTLEQALHFFLLKSANDVGNLIAENVAGSVEAFVELMNEEARLLGATNTHYVNTHGLHDNDHYTTVYDLYLIFQEAIKYDAFNQIIMQTQYTSTYKDAAGEPVTVTVNNTNGYLSGAYTTPTGFTVLGGKTGTTNEAGHCLIIYSKDDFGNPYISIMLCGSTRADLYAQMTEMLEQISE